MEVGVAEEDGLFECEPPEHPANIANMKRSPVQSDAFMFVSVEFSWGIESGEEQLDLTVLVSGMHRKRARCRYLRNKLEEIILCPLAGQLPDRVVGNISRLLDSVGRDAYQARVRSICPWARRFWARDEVIAACKRRSSSSWRATNLNG